MERVNPLAFRPQPLPHSSDASDAGDGVYDARDGADDANDANDANDDGEQQQQFDDANAAVRRLRFGHALQPLRLQNRHQHSPLMPLHDVPKRPPRARQQIRYHVDPFQAKRVG